MGDYMKSAKHRNKTTEKTLFVLSLVGFPIAFWHKYVGYGEFSQSIAEPLYWISLMGLTLSALTLASFDR